MERDTEMSWDEGKESWWEPSVSHPFRSGMNDPASLAMRAHRLTGEDKHLLAAFRLAKERVVECERDDPDYQERFTVLVDVLFSYFDSMGHFAVIDAAVEMLARWRNGVVPVPPVIPNSRSWHLIHSDPSPGVFTRGISDEGWRLSHHDGRTSLVRSKNWEDWLTGGEWPMGWDVIHPNGHLLKLEEAQFGDDWTIVRPGGSA